MSTDLAGSAAPAQSSSPTRLAVEHIDVFYGQAQALFDVSVSVGQGELVGVLGRNGVGKSTLLRTIARAHRKSTGSIELDGEELSKLTADQAALRGVSLVREGAVVFEGLTVSEHLALAARLAERRGEKPDVQTALDWFPMLAERTKLKGGLLSGGQRQMLSLAMALTAKPKLLLLDEPSTGLAEVVAESVFVIVGRLVETGMSLVVAEQDARWLEGLTDRAYTLDGGRVVSEGAPQQVGGAGGVGWHLT